MTSLSNNIHVQHVDGRMLTYVSVTLQCVLYVWVKTSHTFVFSASTRATDRERCVQVDQVLGDGFVSLPQPACAQRLL